jgi:hypothetical protein
MTKFVYVTPNQDHAITEATSFEFEKVFGVPAGYNVCCWECEGKVGEWVITRWFETTEEALKSLKDNRIIDESEYSKAKETIK